MKVVREQNLEQVGRLPSGQAFRHGGGFYMTIWPAIDSNAVDLQTGEKRYFHLEMEVDTLKAEVHIK
jgi:hypothetical protein